MSFHLLLNWRLENKSRVPLVAGLLNMNKIEAQLFADLLSRKDLGEFHNSAILSVSTPRVRMPNTPEYFEILANALRHAGEEEQIIKTYKGEYYGLPSLETFTFIIWNYLKHRFKETMCLKPIPLADAPRVGINFDGPDEHREIIIIIDDNNYTPLTIVDDLNLGKLDLVEFLENMKDRNTRKGISREGKIVAWIIFDDWEEQKNWNGKTGWAIADRQRLISKQWRQNGQSSHQKV